MVRRRRRTTEEAMIRSLDLPGGWRPGRRPQAHDLDVFCRFLRGQQQHLLVDSSDPVRAAVPLRDIVPIEQWLENPYYAGEDGVRGLYDFWKQELANFFHSGRTEWIIFGSLGGGKTTAAMYAVMRVLYELSCYEHPALLYGLMRSTMLWMIYFSISLPQAERSGFGTLARTIKTIPYFQKYFPHNPAKSSVLEFRTVRVGYGSEQAHQIGLDLYGAVLDEGDFFSKKGQLLTDAETFLRAKSLYEATLRRRRLRFNVNGKEHGLSILISSPSYQSPFAESRIQRNQTTQSAYVTEVSGYNITPHRFRSVEEGFWVFPGMESVEPRVLDSVGAFLEVLAALDVPMEPAEAEHLGISGLVRRFCQSLNLKKVPMDFLEDFRSDPVQAVQDILGLSVSFRREFLPLSLIRSQTTGFLAHPFTRSVLSLSTVRAHERVEDYFDPARLVLDRNLPRCIHVDQSFATDKTGIACVAKLADALVGEDETAGIFAVEWMVALTPPSSGEIPLLKIAEFILWLVEDLGLDIRQATFDGFQSRASIQLLNQYGVPASVLSVDKTDEPYLEFKRALYERRVWLYEYEPFLREVPTLVWDRKRRKVDHDSSGAKDVADAVVGAFYSAMVRCASGIVGFHSIDISKSGKATERMIFEELAATGKRVHQSGDLSEVQWQTLFDSESGV